MIEKIKNNSETQIDNFKKEYKQNNIIWKMISGLYHHWPNVAYSLLKKDIPDIEKNMLFYLHKAYPMISVDKKTYEEVEKWVFEEEERNKKKEDKIEAMQILVNPELTKTKSEAQLKQISNTLANDEEVDEFYKINIDILQKWQEMIKEKMSKLKIERYSDLKVLSDIMDTAFKQNRLIDNKSTSNVAIWIADIYDKIIEKWDELRDVKIN